MSNTVFVIRNQDNFYLTKKNQWRSGADNSLLYRTAEKDVALNELVEANSSDILARLEVLEVEIDKHKHPLVEVLAEDPPEEGELLAGEADETDESDIAGEEQSNDESPKPDLALVGNNDSATEDGQQDIQASS